MIKVDKNLLILFMKFYKTGNKLFDEKRYDEAEKIYDKIISVDSKNDIILNKKG